MAILGYLMYMDSMVRRHAVPMKEVVVSYGVPALKIPREVHFAGERVPLEDPDVRERLDRELHVNTFWHSNTIFLLKRGNRWLPRMEEILKKHDVPTDMKYLAVIESDLQNKVSPSRAVGYWQLLRPTAMEFGLEVTGEVDERYHPLRSTEAACQYLLRSYRKFGNWTNAAASYNSGMRGLDRELRSQGVESYYDLLLNEETSRYIFRAIAVKLIFEDPGKFGFNIPEEQLYAYEPLTEIEIQASVDDLGRFALEKGVNYKTLKRYNPWLRKNTLTVVNGKTYIIELPKRKQPKLSNISVDSALSIEEAGTEAHAKDTVTILHK
jgi:hypothetical protein